MAKGDPETEAAKARRMRQFLVVFAIFGGLYGLGALVDDGKDKAVARKAPAEERISEVQAVTECDLAAKRLLLSPDSMDKSWDWHTYWTGFDDRWGIRRDFSAKNAFGVPLPHHYDCQVAEKSGRVLDLKVLDRYRFQ